MPRAKSALELLLLFLSSIFLMNFFSNSETASVKRIPLSIILSTRDSSWSFTLTLQSTRNRKVHGLPPAHSRIMLNQRFPEFFEAQMKLGAKTRGHDHGDSARSSRHIVRQGRVAYGL